MEIINCTIADLPKILELYHAARELQIKREMVIWPAFDNNLMINEIQENRQWKIIQDSVMACNWAITFNDKEIWEEKDQDDAIYIHRLCTNPGFRGKRYINEVVQWAINYAKSINRKYVRLDTLGNNVKLIEHYTSAGFDFLGIFHLANTSTLPKHYQDEPKCCLFQLEVVE